MTAAIARRADRRTPFATALLLMPAVILAVGFLYYPLVFIVQMSFTEGSSYLSPKGPIETVANYTAIVSRYLPNLLVTLQLAALATIVDGELRLDPKPPSDEEEKVPAEAAASS